VKQKSNAPESAKKRCQLVHVQVARLTFVLDVRILLKIVTHKNCNLVSGVMIHPRPCVKDVVWSVHKKKWTMKTWSGQVVIFALNMERQKIVARTIVSHVNKIIRVSLLSLINNNLT
jgi:hypothetical protein